MSYRKVFYALQARNTQTLKEIEILKKNLNNGIKKNKLTFIETY